jgi:hypothetical protein
MDVRVAWIAVGMVLAAGQMGQAAEPAAVIGTAIEKLGGRQKLEAISTLSIIARDRHWDPQETLVPDVGTRLGGTARFTLTQDIAGRRARYDWVRFRIAPMVRTFIYTAVFAGDVGYVLGEDNIVLSKQAKETVPSLHTMSASRVIAHQRELHRQSPRFLIEMQSHPDRLAALPDETIDGKALSVVSYQGDDALWYVLFGSDGLPARIRTIDADGVWGDSNYDLVLADWHDVGGVKFAFDQSFTLNGHEVQHINVDEIVLNPSLYDDLFRIPKIVADTAAKQKASEQVNIQWMLRRAKLGVVHRFRSARLRSRAGLRQCLDRDQAGHLAHYRGQPQRAGGGDEGLPRGVRRADRQRDVAHDDRRSRAAIPRQAVQVPGAHPPSHGPRQRRARVCREGRRSRVRPRRPRDVRAADAGAQPHPQRRAVAPSADRRPHRGQGPADAHRRPARDRPPCDRQFPCQGNYFCLLCR